MLDAVSGPEQGAPYGIHPPENPFIKEVRKDPVRLKIGFHARSAFGRDVHPQCRKAVEQTCKLLESLGHDVEELSPSYAEEDAALNWCIVMLGNLTTLVEQLIETYGHDKVKQNIELTSYALYRIGQRIKAADFVKAEQMWLSLGSEMAKMLDRFDMNLSPTLGEPPVPIGSLQPRKTDIRSMRLLGSWVGSILMSSKKMTYSILGELIQNMMKGLMPFTMIANITGQPAMSVPLYWTDEGLPCGLQFLGRYADEAGLLRLAAQLERAEPWADKIPDIVLNRKSADE